MEENETNIISTGFKTLDNYIDGWHPGDFVLIGGQPSMGKTAFLLSSLVNMVRNSSDMIAVFSLEMKKKHLLKRLAKMIDSFQLDVNEISSMVSSIIIDDTSSISISDIKEKCHSIKKMFGLKAVFIDYLQHIRAGDKVLRAHKDLELTLISRELKILAKEIEVPVIVLTQVRISLKPKFSDIIDLREIRKHADIVLMLYRDFYNNNISIESKEAIIIISKQPCGDTGGVKLRYDKESVTFSDI